MTHHGGAANQFCSRSYSALLQAQNAACRVGDALLTRNRTLNSNRQVIFIGGTSYSGSTLLDMILAHGRGGFSCGEVSATFHPYRRKHIHYLPHAGEAIQIRWDRLIAAGPNAFYSMIFSELPNIQRVIDSSKDPLWIAKRSAALEAQGIATRHVLIWKTPAEFYGSRKKRGRQRNWERAWINYHRHYFRHVRNFASISYKTLVTDQQALAILCDYLRIPYFSGKREYWRSHYQTLFGNASAKRHLLDIDSGDWESDGGDLEVSDAADIINRRSERHREIYYQPANPVPEGSAGRQSCVPYLRFLREAEDNLISRIADAPEPPAGLKASQTAAICRATKCRITSSIVRTITPRVQHT